MRLFGIVALLGTAAGIMLSGLALLVAFYSGILQ
jgi:hypothetical protein